MAKGWGTYQWVFVNGPGGGGGDVCERDKEDCIGSGFFQEACWDNEDYVCRSNSLCGQNYFSREMISGIRTARCYLSCWAWEGSCFMSLMRVACDSSYEGCCALEESDGAEGGLCHVGKGRGCTCVALLVSFVVRAKGLMGANHE